MPEYRSLWIDPPPEEPGRDADTTVRWLVEEEEPPPEPEAAVEPPAEPRRVSRAAGLAGIALLLAIGLVPATQARPLRIQELDSAWGDVAMRCDTVRLEDGFRAVEAFRCRALAGGRLPTGVYGSPESEWTSDVTGRDAAESEMVIGPDGVLHGRAVY